MACDVLKAKRNLGMFSNNYQVWPHCSVVTSMSNICAICSHRSNENRGFTLLHTYLQSKLCNSLGVHAYVYWHIDVFNYHLWTVTWKGSRRCRSTRVWMRSHAAGTTGSGSSRQGPRRFAPHRLQSMWSASGPCASGQTSHQSRMSDCPQVWFSLSDGRTEETNADCWNVPNLYNRLCLA